MSGEHPELDDLQATYRTALETWIASIKKEEALASMNHSMIEIDEWEKAHFSEEETRENVKSAKANYEDALRAKFFGF
jgi:hypothetical protein